MKIRYFFYWFAVFTTIAAHSQKENNIKSIMEIFNSDQKWIQRAVDSSICIIRQEYTLIDNNHKEFGANSKPYWGYKYGVGVITDSGIFSLGSILMPWVGDKDLEDLKNTDIRHLQPFLSKRFYKRPMEKNFMQWNRYQNSSTVNDSGKLKNNSVQEGQVKTKKDNRKKEAKDTTAMTQSLTDSLVQKESLKLKPIADNRDIQVFQDSILVSFAVSDSISSMPLAKANADSTGWLVIVTSRYQREISDTSQLVYTIVKPSYISTRTPSGMYIREPSAIKQNFLGGIYYIAKFSCGRILFSAAGLLNKDAKGWFINSFDSGDSKTGNKITDILPTPISEMNK